MISRIFWLKESKKIIILHVGWDWQRSWQRWLLKNDSERYVFVYPAFLSFSLDCCHDQFLWAFVVFWSCVVCNVFFLNELRLKKMYITSFWFPWCPLVSCVSFGYICLYIYISSSIIFIYHDTNKALTIPSWFELFVHKRCLLFILHLHHLLLFCGFISYLNNKWIFRVVHFFFLY